MKLTIKLGLVAAIVLASGAMASAASAADWQTANTGAFTGSAGASRLIIHGPAGDVALNCTTSTGSGSLNPSPPAGTNPWLNAASITPAFSGCTVAGTPFTVTCAVATLRTGTGPGAYSGGTTLATADGGVTSGSLASISCQLKIGATTCSTVTGTVQTTYTNPTQPSTAGKLTVLAAGQNLTATGTACAAIPQGSANFGSPSVPPGNLVYNVTSPATPSSQPYVWYGT